MKIPGGRTAAVLLFFLTAASLPAEDSGVTEYRIEITRFPSAGLDNEHLYLAEALPRLLLHSLAGVENHYLSGRERSLRKEYLRRESRRSRVLEEAKSVHKDSLSRLKEGFQQLQDTDEAAEEAASAMDDPEKLPVSISNVPGELKNLPEDAAAYCRTNSIDMILSGTVEPIGDLLYFSLRSYLAAEGVWRRFYFSTSGFTSLEDALAQARGAVREQVIGGPWSSLTVITDRNDASVFVENTLAGVGSVYEKIYTPGKYTVRVEAEAAEPVYRSLELLPGEESRIEIELTPAAVPLIGISSFPVGADVYLSSRWVGTTPLFLPDTGRGGTVRIALDGYRSIMLPADDIAPGKNSFELEKELYSTSMRMKEKKDKLYNSVGMFTLSLPLTMFSYSLYTDYWNQAVLYDDTGISQKAVLYNGLFYGTLCASGVLFAHMVESLFEYRAAGKDTF